MDIDSKEFCARQPEALRRVQVLSNVDHQSVVGAFKTRRAKDPRDTCAVGTISGGFQILVDAEWILTASKEIVDAILPRLRESIFAPPRLSDDVERAGPVPHRPYGILSVRTARPSEFPYIAVFLTARWRGLLGE